MTDPGIGATWQDLSVMEVVINDWAGTYCANFLFSECVDNGGFSRVWVSESKVVSCVSARKSELSGTIPNKPDRNLLSIRV